MWRRSVRCTSSEYQAGSAFLSAEATINLLLDRGADINGVNEADFTALHGAAMRD